MTERQKQICAFALFADRQTDAEIATALEVTVDEAVELTHGGSDLMGSGEVGMIHSRGKECLGTRVRGGDGEGD